MTISTEKKFDILYDHYKETFSYVREYLKNREKLFVFALIVVFLQFLQISFSDQYIQVFSSFVEKQFNLNFIFNKEFLNGVLWFLLFSISLRYFQTNVLINRQYGYLHSLEDKLCDQAEDKNFISREGQGYLKDYPAFSDWAHIIYTWVFPILLIFVALVKIVLEHTLKEKFSCSLFLGDIFFIAICITTILYLVHIHKKK
ncbi:hypothetical protein KAU19_06180 [Candidatus Parcubacteria bacterium]|nr:hypothetical protein [Candidatus Parcubacteria bacterium]